MRHYSKPMRQLCDYNSGYGALRCNNYSGCPGSNNGWCYPNNVWSGTVSGSNYYRGYLNSGTFNVNGNVSTNAFGVRCVPGFKTKTKYPLWKIPRRVLNI
ncbi:MAG: hypothetical protein OSJ27_07115 [Candidatus Gastranaerophilales bacterium]|nr:hypothetical protein [Candidatus Gastranaerophilales bacterium]